MNGLRIGELFSGYGGLGMGVQAVLGGSIAWHSEIDPGARKILAHRHPDVPNLGDITAVDWSQVEPVDVLTGGFPCQDVSMAGKRAGLNDDTRSGLWAHMVRAIDELRPPLVVAENVRGLLSACATSELEPCPRCLGDESQPHRSVLRALGRVLGDLADLGYDAQWYGLRAADVGAPHGRFRVFVFAWPATDPAQDANLAARSERRVAAPGQAEGWRARADAGRRGGASAAHSGGVGGERRREHGDVAGPSGAGEGHGGGRQRHGDAADDRGATTADAHGDGVVGSEAGRHPVRADERLHALRRDPDTGADDTAADTDRGGQRADLDDVRAWEPDIDWGAYGPAVHRWERALGRVAPPPTEPGEKGQPRLSPRFVEWLMGLPAGWVTDVPGITRNEALKALGNGVVPQQAAAALRLLLAETRAAA